MIHTIKPEVIYFDPKELENYKLKKIKEGIPPTDSLGRNNSAISSGFVEEFAKKYYQSLQYSVLSAGEYLITTQLKFGNLDRRYRIKYDEKHQRFCGVCSKMKSISRIEIRRENEKILKEYGIPIERKKLNISYPYNERENDIILKKLGKEKFELICDCNASFLGSHPDLFVYNDNEYFFVEVKSKKDKLFCNQLVFISFVKYTFNICDCKILKVLPEGSEMLTKFYKWNFEELFELEQFNTFPCYRYSMVR